VVKLAKEADPAMMRTLGVLTKPDRIAPGEEAQWRGILEGTRYPLTLGWYMVKNPNQKELDGQITFEGARSNEQAFFDANPALKVPSRVGTNHLRQTLSKQLVELIKRILPDMVQVLHLNLDQSEAELKTLPTAIADPVVEFATLASRTRDDLLAIVTASAACPPAGKAIYRNFKAMFADYQQSIMQTQPVFKLARSNHSGSEWKHVLVACNAEGSDLLRACSAEEADRLRFKEHAGMDNPMEIADVSAIIDKERGLELPGSTPYPALVSLVQQFQKDWADLAEGCFDVVAAEMLACAQEKVASIFKRFPEMRMTVRSAALAIA
jgi:vacuolar protein sorting-associated protein 1